MGFSVMFAEAFRPIIENINTYTKSKYKQPKKVCNQQKASALASKSERARVIF